MVAIDSDVFLLDLMYQRDVRCGPNARFLEAVRAARPATTVYNLMEVLGKLSFNVPAKTLDEWPDALRQSYGLTVIWPDPADLDADSFFHGELYQRPLALMKAQRVAFLDALVLSLVERTPDVEAFVTWNARHFRGKTSLPVVTPEEYLTAGARQL